MKRMGLMGLLAVAAGAGMLAAVSGLHAQGRSGVTGRIVCVDVVKVFDEYERQKDLSDEMHKLQEDLKAESQKRRERIDSLQQTLDAMNTADPTYTKKMQEMLQLQIDYKNWTDLMQLGMAREVGVWTQRIYNEMLATIQQTAQQNGYAMVFYKEMPQFQTNEPDALKNEIRMRKLIWAADATDITQTIIDRLNEKYRKEPKTQMIQLTP